MSGWPWLIGDRVTTQKCIELLAAQRQNLGAPVPVIAEASWLILDRLGVDAQRRFLALIPSGDLLPIDLTSEDWVRTISLCETYRDLRLDVMDACIVAVAERLGLTTIASMNTRDFSVVRPIHCDALELLA